MPSGDTPAASSKEVSRRMKQTGRRDTEPELALRSELHRRGLRYRVDHRPEADLRTRADLVFKGPRVAVFVDGCFWHACPQHATQPASNADWWREKLEANAARDQRVTQALEDRGWHVIRIWEHEDPDEAADKVEDAVLRRKSQ